MNETILPQKGMCLKFHLKINRKHIKKSGVKNLYGTNNLNHPLSHSLMESYFQDACKIAVHSPNISVYYPNQNYVVWSLPFALQTWLQLLETNGLRVVDFSESIVLNYRSRGIWRDS